MHFVQLTAKGGGTPFHELEAQIRCIESPDIKKNEDLEDENRRPKQMLADLSLENRHWKTLSKKALKPACKRELVTHQITTFGLSVHQACRSLNQSRTVSHYRPDTTWYDPVIVVVQAVDERYSSIRFSKLFQVLRQQVRGKSQLSGHAAHR